jgi:hypothetical protein
MLVVGHPGHELRVHGWLERARPAVMVLTDGSGHHGRSRLASSAALIERAGASPGTVFGSFTDAAIYQMVLDHRIDAFRELACELAAALVSGDIECVVGDAAEGYNPTHDICRLVIDAAVRMAQAVRPAQIANLAFSLVERPDASYPAGKRHLDLVLDDAALARKLRAAREYAELADEVNGALAAWGVEAFRTERMWHVEPGDTAAPAEIPPFYERHGEMRVDSGTYARVLRYRDHVQPLAEALMRLGREAAPSGFR